MLSRIEHVISSFCTNVARAGQRRGKLLAIVHRDRNIVNALHERGRTLGLNNLYARIVLKSGASKIYVGFASMIAVMSFTSIPALAASVSLPNWVIIKPGAVGYLDDEGAGGKSDPSGRRTVCKNLAAYVHREEDDDAGCAARRAFGLVRVVRIVDHNALIYKKGTLVVKAPMVTIASLSGGWSGVVIGLAILPMAPIGTKLLLHPGALGSRSPLVKLKYGDKPADGFQISERTTVEVIGRHVPDNEHYPIKVRILTGKHRNENVWTLLYTVPYPAFWMQDPANVVP